MCPGGCDALPLAPTTAAPANARWRPPRPSGWSQRAVLHETAGQALTRGLVAKRASVQCWR
eukprot:6612573-Alexandrium_andersonii.AAC.1